MGRDVNWGGDGVGAGPVAEAWRVDLSRGLRSLAAGQFERAEGFFARAHRLAPEQPEVCFALGRERLRQSRYAEAERLLRAAWERDRTLYTAAASLSRCLAVGMGRLADAHRVIDEALCVFPNEPGLHVVKGEIYLEQELAEPARREFEDAHKLVEESGREAIATLSAIVAGLARSYNLEGVELGRVGRADEALFAFKRAADLDPEWSGPIVNMGVAFAQLGRAARARSCYERALAKDPGNLVARFNLANLARDAGDLGRAEHGYRTVLEVDPEYPGVRLALAEIQLERGDSVRAIDTLRAELDRDDENPTVWFQLGVAYEHAGDIGQAEKHLRNAIALDDEHLAASCHLARLLARDGRYLEAAALARRAQEIDPERATAYLGGDEREEN